MLTFRNNSLLMVATYFTGLLMLAPIMLLHFDSYYYWEWSRHLDLSYYDGAPMIAYLIKIATSIFGDTLFSKFMLALNRFLILASKGLFSFQILYRLRIK